MRRTPIHRQVVVSPQPERDAEREPIVDWGRAGRRLRASALVLGLLAVTGWAVVGVLRGGPVLADLGDWVGLAVGAMFVVEVVVVGGSAARGMVRAGDRGDRLAGRDVGLLPPRMRR